jgi:hypothetical protein
VPIPDDLRKEIETSPEEFGLSARLPKAQRLASLLALGAEVARQRVREQQLRAALAEWAEDEEGRETMRMMQQIAFESGKV